MKITVSNKAEREEKIGHRVFQKNDSTYLLFTFNDWCIRIDVKNNTIQVDDEYSINEAIADELQELKHVTIKIEL